MHYDVMAVKEQEEHQERIEEEQHDRFTRRVLLDEAVERLKKAWSL